jgi:hypothetical protein
MAPNNKPPADCRPLNRDQTDDTRRTSGGTLLSPVGRRISDHLLHGILDNVVDGVVTIDEWGIVQ